MLRADYQKLLERIRNLPPPQPPVEKKLAPSTQRTKRSKRRKKQGLRCINVLVSEDALDALVKLEFLNPDDRPSRAAVQIALGRYIVSSLVEKFVFTPWAIAARQQREMARVQPSPKRKTNQNNQVFNAPKPP
jgi:hypothetical protein